MISMRSFLTRNTFYLLSVLLLTIITVQIVITPQLGAHEEEKKDDSLPPPLPMLTVEACTGAFNAFLSVDPYIVNWNYVTLEDNATIFTGTATGHTETKTITSVIYETDRNGQTVPKHLNHKIIWAQVAYGDLTETAGLSADKIVGLYRESG